MFCLCIVRRIQAAFRGYCMRKKYSHLLPCRRPCFYNMVWSPLAHHVYDQDHETLMMNVQLTRSTDHLLGQLVVHDNEIDELFKEIDECVKKSNEDIEVAEQEACEALLAPPVVEESEPEIDWQPVITKVLYLHICIISVDISHKSIIRVFYYKVGCLITARKGIEAIGTFQLQNLMYPWHPLLKFILIYGILEIYESPIAPGSYILYTFSRIVSLCHSQWDCQFEVCVVFDEHTSNVDEVHCIVPTSERRQ